MPYYLNQTEIQCEDSERLHDVIRAAETLGFGVRIENIRMPQGEGAETVAWMVTRFEEVPSYDEWDGRYDEDPDEEDDGE